MPTSHRHEDRVRLTENERMLLISLLKGRMNKYFLSQQWMLDNEESSRMSSGTLYPAILRLKAMGFIYEYEVEAEKATAGNEYEVTSLGREVLSWELMRLQDQINLGKERYRK
jgi:DNA-binding PadR family transcriptional regulator